MHETNDGWLQLERCEKSRQSSVGGELLYGRELLEEYQANEFHSDHRLQWLRDACTDVRETLGITDLAFEVVRIQIYKELKVVWEVPWWESFFLRKRAEERPRRGMVRTSDPITLYLSQEGKDMPRVVYEEIAHSMSIVVSTKTFVPSPRDKPDPTLLIQLAEISDRLGHVPSKMRRFVKCHRVIFRGILKNSEALAKTTNNADREFVRTALKECEKTCKELHGESACEKRCDC